MGIEGTITVRRSDAIQMLKQKYCTVYSNDCLERLSLLLYENRESDCENYDVVEDDYIGSEWENYKTCW